ncbi:NAD-dependent epimerase/dehydratase family protein [Inhella sp.]|uniref:NAD-dependent epimerase/dehydratase family protein n=1 Tax=Inhella sp. TaxID=1921806 RepID=UPI0035B45567
MPTLPDFLAEDFERLGEALTLRARQLDGHRLILSGATGFFGQNLLALFVHLWRAGARFEVTALSRSPAAFVAAHTWAGELPWLRWVQGNAREPWPVRERHDLMLHAATDTHAAAHLDLQAVFDEQLSMARNAMACAAACGVQRLLLTGSGAQYAEATAPLKEDAAACDPGSPSSAYGEGKRCAEMLGALHARFHGTAMVNTRCFAFVGPGLALDGHFAIGNFISSALDGRPLKLSSAGGATRSYLYGADLALWLTLLLLEAPAGSTFNVGSDRALTVLELAHRITSALHPGLAIEVGSSPAQGARHFYVPDTGRARRAGLDVWTSLDQAIERTARWHRAAI